MKIELSALQTQALLDFARQSEDAEQLSEGAYTMDIYELEPPLSIEFELIQSGIDALSAFELLYDAQQDGWYLGEKIEDAQALRQKLLGWTLLG